MSGWFSDTELASLRALAEVPMTSDVAIYKRHTDPASDPKSIYGQNVDDYAYTETVLGWLYSTPNPLIIPVAGVMALVNVYRLFLPVGTDFHSGDRAIIGGSWFTCQDTVEESTWLPLLRCSLRRVE